MQEQKSRTCTGRRPSHVVTIPWSRVSGRFGVRDLARAAARGRALPGSVRRLSEVWFRGCRVRAWGRRFAPTSLIIFKREGAVCAVWSPRVSLAHFTDHGRRCVVEAVRVTAKVIAVCPLRICRHCQAGGEQNSAEREQETHCNPPYGLLKMSGRCAAPKIKPPDSGSALQAGSLTRLSHEYISEQLARMTFTTTDKPVPGFPVRMAVGLRLAVRGGKRNTMK